MGRSPDRWKSVHHPEFWQNAKKFYRLKPWIRLRPAANLVGIFNFPHGWLATEYDAIEEEDTCDVETIWRREFCRATSARSEFGKEAAKMARIFRRNSVEEFLKFNLVRQLVQYECISVVNPKAPAYVNHPSELPANSIEFGKLNIESSSVGNRASKQHIIQVDVLALLDRLIDQHETRGSRSKINRHAVEHFARRFIETWEPKGTTNLTKQTIINAVADPETGAKGGSQVEVATMNKSAQLLMTSGRSTAWGNKSHLFQQYLTLVHVV